MVLQFSKSSCAVFRFDPGAMMFWQMWSERKWLEKVLMEPLIVVTPLTDATFIDAAKVARRFAVVVVV